MGENKARRSGVRKLVDRARKGDDKAFEALIGGCRTKILYLALQYAGNPNDAEDCAQEAVLKAYRGIGNLKDPDAFDSWMHSIVKYTCFRRNGAMERDVRPIGGDDRAHDALMALEEARVEFLPAEYAEDAEKRSFVLKQIRELSENYREALLLFYYEGLSYKEIATVLGVNANKVTNDLKRARQALKKKIEEANGTVLASAALPVGAPLTLTRVYELDCVQSVTPEMQERLMRYADSLCAASASVGAAASGFGAKLAIGGASTLLAAGVAVGAVFLGADDVSAAEEPLAATEPVKQPQPVEPEFKPSAEDGVVEEPIETLAEMIGFDEESQLSAYRGQGAAASEVAAFLDGIGAQQRGYAEQLDGSTFAVYELVKQGKQLFVVLKMQRETETVAVAYRFGDVGPAPDMFEFVSMFDQGDLL